MKVSTYFISKHPQEHQSTIGVCPTVDDIQAKFDSLTPNGHEAKAESNHLILASIAS
ncbi:MAG: hypothetical protein QW279_05505 [Candidatus Jordarchaeaceae archaeon]